MKRPRRLRRTLVLLLSGTLLTGAITFAEGKRAFRVCTSIEVIVANDTGPRLFEKQDLISQITTSTPQPVIDTLLQDVVTRDIGNIVKSNRFVRAGFVYKTWKGVLKVVLHHKRPVARILHSAQEHQYIDEKGLMLPLSESRAARVPLIEIERPLSIEKGLTDYTHGEELLALLNYIDQNPFWRSQTAYLFVDEQGKVTMRTQVGSQRVELGFPKSVREKLAKLDLFYKQIAPYKGWSTYKRINVEFDKQIICE